MCTVTKSVTAQTIMKTGTNGFTMIDHLDSNDVPIIFTAATQPTQAEQYGIINEHLTMYTIQSRTGILTSDCVWKRFELMTCTSETSCTAFSDPQIVVLFDGTIQVDKLLD